MTYTLYYPFEPPPTLIPKQKISGLTNRNSLNYLCPRYLEVFTSKSWRVFGQSKAAQLQKKMINRKWKHSLQNGIFFVPQKTSSCDLLHIYLKHCVIGPDRDCIILYHIYHHLAHYECYQSACF